MIKHSTLSLIYKGFILYTTVFAVLTLLCGLEDIIIKENHSLLTFWVAIDVVLLSLCYYNISYKELCILSGKYWFDNYIDKKDKTND